MKRSLFLLCLTGFVPVTLSLLRPVARKYSLIETQMTWPVAKNYCRETYDDLATIESEYDWFKLSMTLGPKLKTVVAWIGLYNDIHSWRWSFSEVPLKDTFALQWYSGHPYTSGSDPTCCIISGSVQLFDFPCSYTNPFICFNALISNVGRYVGISTAMSWSDAQTYCRMHYTDLAFINSTKDFNLVQSVVSTLSWPWVGVYRDTWKWLDGTNSTDLRWLSGKPDNYASNENCVSLCNGLFDDFQCNLLRYPICQTTHPVREVQIVKLTVSSDGSVMDSAMQEDILEMVKMKLDENGMLMNTTVTWKVQPDGEIFQKKKKEPLDDL